MKRFSVRAVISRPAFLRLSGTTLVAVVVLSTQAGAQMKTGQVQLRLDSVPSSQMPKQKQRGPVAETFKRYEVPSPGLVPLVSVDAPGGGQWLAPQYSDVPQYISIRTSASSFRVGTQDKIAFTLTTDRDDAEKIKLFRFSRGKHGREYQTGRWMVCLGGGGTLVPWRCRDFVPNQGLLVNVEKLTESSYRVTPSSPLDSGEYGLALGELVFTFGVGAPSK
jgi:hypothetical protein